MSYVTYALITSSPIQTVTTPDDDTIFLSGPFVTDDPDDLCYDCSDALATYATHIDAQPTHPDDVHLLCTSCALDAFPDAR